MKSPWVWAPSVARVELITKTGRVELERGQAGIFFATEPLAPGTEYAFELAGTGPLPDPRSRWQPDGVHGFSKVLGREFEWTDSGFRACPLSAGVLYELHVGTFSIDGTFEGVIPRLPHLRALGITHVELMPIAEFPGRRGWGYDGVSLFAAHSGYGGPLALKRLVDACHAHGLAVLLDVVHNHFGPDGNYLPRFGPYLTDSFHTPWGAGINLDGPQSEPVRRFLIDSALQWLEEFHFDGLRLDAVHALFDRTARHYLRQLADEVALLSDRLARPLVLIAESDLNDPRLIRPRESGGYGLDAQWNDDFHHALHVALTGERHGIYHDFAGLADLARAFERGLVYDGQYSAFRQRYHGMPLENLSLRRLVVFLQNHDQIGNRARGERIGQLVSAARVKIGAALVLLGPFVPMLFQGEEWNASAPFQYFTDHVNPELARCVSEGRRREFAEYSWSEAEVPDPQSLATFEASRLDFDEIAEPEHAAMLEFYRTLIRLRRERPELAVPRVSVRFDERSGFFALDRQESVVAVNFGREPLRVPLSRDETLGPAELLCASEGAAIEDSTLVLPRESLLVATLGRARGPRNDYGATSELVRPDPLAQRFRDG
jgi:maltooligosyltrehalose trehalohydrolase